MLYFGKSDVGRKRSHNEDSFSVKEVCQNCTLAVVCDGMGGASGGNVASSLAIGAFTAKVRDFLTPSIDPSGVLSIKTIDVPSMLSQAVALTNKVVYEKAQMPYKFDDFSDTSLCSALFYPVGSTVSYPSAVDLLLSLFIHCQ